MNANNNPLYFSDQENVTESQLAAYIQAMHESVYFSLCANFWFNAAPANGGEYLWERGKYYDRLAVSARQIIPAQFHYIVFNQYETAYRAGLDCFTYNRRPEPTPADYGDFAGALE